MSFLAIFHHRIFIFWCDRNKTPRGLQPDLTLFLRVSTFFYRAAPLLSFGVTILSRILTATVEGTPFYQIGRYVLPCADCDDVQVVIFRESSVIFPADHFLCAPLLSTVTFLVIWTISFAGVVVWHFGGYSPHFPLDVPPLQQKQNDTAHLFRWQKMRKIYHE